MEVETTSEELVLLLLFFFLFCFLAKDQQADFCGVSCEPVEKCFIAVEK